MHRGKPYLHTLCATLLFDLGSDVNGILIIIHSNVEWEVGVRSEAVESTDGSMLRAGVTIGMYDRGCLLVLAYSTANSNSLNNSLRC